MAAIPTSVPRIARGFTVRLGQRSDLPIYNALAVDIFEHDFGYPPGHQPLLHHPDPLDVDDFDRVFARLHKHALFVAVDDATGAPIGFAALKRVREGLVPDAPAHLIALLDRDDTAEIVRVYIDRAHRRRGIGRALVAAARTFVESEPSYARLYLHTDGGYPEAPGFWSSLGTLVHDNRMAPPSGSEGMKTLFFELPLGPGSENNVEQERSRGTEMATDVTKPATRTEQGFTVRRARTDDLAACRAISIEVFEKDFGYGYLPQYHFDVDDLKKYYLDPKEHALFVAIDDTTGKVLGLAGVKHIRKGVAPDAPAHIVAKYENPQTAELVRVYTAHNARRRGVGKALVAAAKAYAESEPVYTTMFLHTDASYPGAKDFWLSQAALVHDNRKDANAGDSKTMFFEIQLNK